MKDYLQFVWESLMHPQSLLDLLAPFQLLIFILFSFYAVRAFIEIYKFKNK